LTDSRLRVAAVGVSLPNYKASGGISAGLQLMRRVADSCETAMYVMADRDEDIVDGRLKVALRRPYSPLSTLGFLMPRQVTTMAWRPRIEGWLEEISPDIVHIHNPHPAGALARVAGACRSRGIPYVISTHGFVEFNDFSRGFGSPAWQKPLLEHFVRRPLVEVARNAARILMLSPYDEPILRGMGVGEDRLGIVPNGVDRYFLDAPSEVERQRLIARFDLPNDCPLLLFVGNHTVNKGLDVLLRSLPMMKERAVAVIAGSVRSKAENRQLVESSGLRLDDRRFLFTDFITKEELRALYRSVNVFVFPSRADTLPLVILEAMASGLPVVATDVGGIPYEVTPAEGILVSAGDPAALAEALDRMCRDEAMRFEMGVSGKRRVVSQFDWEISARLSIDNYRMAIA
jgi:glycosyltransferase involved in cell wall biosynthesis